MNGADIILDLCSLPILTRYRLKYQETIANLPNKPLYLPLTQVEATQIKNTLTHMVTDISILNQALSLPIFTPLTPSRITKLSKCAISALYCAVLTSIACSILNMASNSNTGSKAQTVSNTTTASTTLATTTITTTNSASNNVASDGGETHNSSVSNTSDENEENARFIVDKAIEVHTIIGNMFKKGARNNIYQNHLCIGTWLLVSGIQGALGASGSSVSGATAGAGANNNISLLVKEELSKIKPKASVTSEAIATTAPTVPTTCTVTIFTSGIHTVSPQPQQPTIIVQPNIASTARVNLFKVQQGFGVLNAAIASHCIKLFTELIDDLNIEITSVTVNIIITENSLNHHHLYQQQIPEPANFDILENYSTFQRVLRILNTATLHQLFTFLATVTYRKACNLRRANTKDRTECEPISYSDSTTYFNDTLSCSDNSEEDDSESYLGNWFKETLLPESVDDTSSTNVCQEPGTNVDAQKKNLVSAVDEPHEYLELSAQIFSFLDKFFSQKHFYIQRYVKAGLSDQQMVLLANILKDLDRDSARGELENVNNINNSEVNSWHTAMIRFSGTVGRYLHNLISANLVTETLQSNLLQHLGILPWPTETNVWPLQVYSSTLSVLVQIILLKPAQEKEAACISVWHRLINTLVEGVCGTSSTNPPSDNDYEDLNIEHAQLLLFLFHSLNLMQKKSILLLTAGGIIRCAEMCRESKGGKVLRNSQIMLLSRLLLFLEYLMKHLYNAPPDLLDQVRWNLFSTSTMSDNQKPSDLLANKTKLSSFCYKDLEEKFRKNSGDCLSSM